MQRSGVHGGSGRATDQHDCKYSQEHVVCLYYDAILCRRRRSCGSGRQRWRACSDCRRVLQRRRRRPAAPPATCAVRRTRPTTTSCCRCRSRCLFVNTHWALDRGALLVVQHAAACTCKARRGGGAGRWELSSVARPRHTRCLRTLSALQGHVLCSATGAGCWCIRRATGWRRRPTAACGCATAAPWVRLGCPPLTPIRNRLFVGLSMCHDVFRAPVALAPLTLCAQACFKCLLPCILECPRARGVFANPASTHVRSSLRRPCRWQPNGGLQHEGADSLSFPFPFSCPLCAGLRAPPACCLCPVAGGALKATTCGRWAHMACALWSPDAVGLDPERGLIDGIEQVRDTKRKAEKEQICQGDPPDAVGWTLSAASSTTSSRCAADSRASRDSLRLGGDSR